jgi:hypothetical protein
MAKAVEPIFRDEGKLALTSAGSFKATTRKVKVISRKTASTQQLTTASLELCKELYELSGWDDTYLFHREFFNSIKKTGSNNFKECE